MNKILCGIAIAMMFFSLMSCSTTEAINTTVEQAQAESDKTTVESDKTAIETEEDTQETEDTQKTAEETTSVNFINEKSYTWVINTNTKKFHYESCPSVDQMSETNKQISHYSASELMAYGYLPCQRCNPAD